MGIKDKCEIWEDVFDESIDNELAPELSQVANKEFASKISPIYTDSLEFFKRTYFSPSMLNVLEKLVAVLKGKKDVSNVFAIYSLFGGGKTHTLLTIYHAFTNPKALRDSEVLENLEEDVANRLSEISYAIEEIKEDIEIVIVYGKDHSGPFGGGTPARPYDWGSYKTHTVWGLIGHQLDRYDIVRGDDENNTAPSPQVLARLFEGKKVLLLVDELVELAHNLSNSGNEKEKNYANNIPTFVERITKAIHGTNSALLITMPFEVKNQELRNSDKWYSDNLLKPFWKALKNVGEIISPLIHTKERDDIVKVLKKRIFKHIEIDEETIKKIRETYTQYKDIFGDFEEPYLEEYYPYHPEFITALRDIVEKAELQKTRDMLAITRFVIRKLWESNENPSLVMLWHIDPKYPKINAKLFQSYTLGPYMNVYNNDVIDGVSKIYPPTSPKGRLASMILTTILLKTYYHDSPQKLQTFPVKYQIARMVYEPVFFTSSGLNPTHIIDVLETLKKSMSIVYLYTSEGYYWFWKTGNIKSMVESEAKRLLSKISELDNIIWTYTQKLMKGEVRVAGIKKPTVKKIFNINNTMVLKDWSMVVEDERRYYIVFIPEDSVDREKIKDITFKYGASTRKYRNTVVTVYMNEDSLRPLRKFAAMMLACDKVMSKVKKEKNKALMKIQKEMVAELKDTIENDLIKTLMANYSKITYPTRKENMDDIEIIDAPESSTNLIDMVYNSLRKPGIKKIFEEASTFEELNDLLENKLNINLSKGSSIHTVREIMEWFYTNPNLPFVDDKDIKYALIDGVKTLEIGLESPAGEIYFVKYFDRLPETEVEKSNSPPKIDENWKVIPKKEAAKRLVRKLLEEDGKIKNGVLITYKFYPQLDSEFIPLSEIADDEDLDYYLNEGYIVRETKEPPKQRVKIILEPSEISGKPGDIIQINFKVELESGELNTVNINAPIGSIELSNNELPLEGVWKIQVPEGSGMKYYTLNVASDEEPIHAEGGTLRLSIESVYQEKDSITEEDKGKKIVEVYNIRDLSVLETLSSLGNIRVSGEAVFYDEMQGNITLILEDTESQTAINTLALLRDAIGLKNLNLSATFSEEVPITENVITKLLFVKARFKMKR